MRTRLGWAIGAFAFLLLSGSTLQGANLIVNPDFSSVYSGWTFVGSSGVQVGGDPRAFVYEINGGVTQTVATNIGDTYLVEFQLGSVGGTQFAPGGSLMIIFGGETGFLTTSPLPDSLAAYSFTVEAAGTTAGFSMIGSDLEGGLFYLDVSVTNITDTLVPEPSGWLFTLSGGLVTLIGVRRARQKSLRI